MQEMIGAIQSQMSSNSFYFWLFFYFGLGYALFSIVTGLVYFAVLVRKKSLQRELSAFYANILIFVFGALSMSSGFAILTVFRVLTLGHVDVPEVASLALLVGGFIQVVAHIFLNKKHIVFKNRNSQ